MVSLLSPADHQASRFADTLCSAISLTELLHADKGSVGCDEQLWEAQDLSPNADNTLRLQFPCPQTGTIEDLSDEAFVESEFTKTGS